MHSVAIEKGGITAPAAPEYADSPRPPPKKNFAQQFISFGQKCLEQTEEQEARYREVHAHYELMDEFHIPVPEIEYAAYQTLAQDFQSYKSSLEVAEASKEEYVQRFTVDLSKEVEEVEKDGNMLRERAQHEMVLDEASNMDSVLGFTGDLMAKMGTLKQQAARIRRHQQLFKVTEHEFETLEAIAEEIELKHTLWQSMQEWGELTEKWAKVCVCLGGLDGGRASYLPSLTCTLNFHAAAA